MAGWGKFLRDASGSMAIETAFVIPILGTLCFGGFEASQMVARHTEMQTAMSEAAAIVLASPPDTESKRTTVEEVIETSTGLAADKVTLELTYRCGAEEEFTSALNICLGDDATDDNDEDEGGYTVEEVSTFIRIEMQDTYTPLWVDFGIGEPVDFDVERTVQIG